MQLLGRSGPSEVDQGPWPTASKVHLLLVAMAVFFDGFDNQLLGLALPAIIREYGVGTGAFGIVIALSLTGLGLGSALGGIAGDRYGCKRALAGCLVLVGLASGATALATSTNQLMILRFVAGLGMGAVFPLGATLAARFSPPRIRSQAVLMVVVCVPIGGMVGSLVSAMVLPALGWRALFIMGTIAPVIWAFVLAVSLPADPEAATSTGSPSPSGAHERPNLSTLLAFPYRRNTLALWGALFCSMFAVYSVLNWFPTLLTSLGLDIATASRAVAAYNLGGIIGPFICAALIGRYGSRPLMIAMAVFAAASAGLLMVSAPTVDQVRMISLVFLHGLFVNTNQTTLYLLAGHIYPDRMKASGTGIALAVGRTGAIIGGFAIGAIIEAGALAFFAALITAMLGAAVCIAMIGDHIQRLDRGIRRGLSAKSI